MSRLCKITGKKTMSGNNRSHAMNATKRKFFPNLHYHRFWNEKKKCFVRLRITSFAIRLIDKKGLEQVLSKNFLNRKLIGNMICLKKIEKK